MKIHPIQTGTVRCKDFQIHGAANNLSRIYQLLFTQRWGEWMPTYAWLIETVHGELILVDTGETASINDAQYLNAGKLYHKAVQTKISPKDEIQHGITNLGYQLSDISKIILTHLHGDHIGGLRHFEHCNIYVSRSEYKAATASTGVSKGYFKHTWPTWFDPILLDYTDGPEGVFSQSHMLDADQSIIIVPTPGHSIGHQSIIIKSEEQTYFIAGDITYNMSTLQNRIADTILMNRDAQNSVDQACEYVIQHDAIFLSSHDWLAPDYL